MASKQGCPVLQNHRSKLVKMFYSKQNIHTSTFCMIKRINHPFPSSHTSRVNYYTILKLEQSATLPQIKTAYYEHSKNLHPDKNPSKEAKTAYLDVKEAYDVLSDKSKRKAYDRALGLQNLSLIHI